MKYVKMRLIPALAVFGLGLFGVAAPALGITNYVDGAGTNPVSPFTSWETAATNIQDALNVATNSDTVLVATGTYALAAQLSLTNAVTLRSAGAASNTTIRGTSGIRCVYITASGALVDGLTITAGNIGTGSGGGVYMLNGSVINCTVTSNAGRYGCGIYMASGMVSNCVIIANTRWVWATSGG